MITTSREAVNALDIWHRSVIEVMSDRGLLRIEEAGDQQERGDAE